MSGSFLEHINVTVTDPVASADELCILFDWKIRWQGESIYGGQTVHVGNDNSYIALYSMGNDKPPVANTYATLRGLNHIAVVVDDLDVVERKVEALGYEPTSHADYEPGKRFYFKGMDRIEIEVVSYA